VKKFFLMFRRNFLCFSLCPLPLVLSLGTTEKSLAPSSSWMGQGPSRRELWSHFCPNQVGAAGAAEARSLGKWIVLPSAQGFPDLRWEERGPGLRCRPSASYWNLEHSQFCTLQ